MTFRFLIVSSLIQLPHFEKNEVIKTNLSETTIKP